MTRKNYDAIDTLFEQAIWIIAIDEHKNGILKKIISFDPKTGLIIQPKRNRVYNYDIDMKTIKCNSTEELYDLYLKSIYCSKEKAYINCERDDLFNTHTLVKQMYWGKLSEIKTHLVNNFPELLI